MRGDQYKKIRAARKNYSAAQKLNFETAKTFILAHEKFGTSRPNTLLQPMHALHFCARTCLRPAYWRACIWGRGSQFVRFSYGATYLGANFHARKNPTFAIAHMLILDTSVPASLTCRHDNSGSPGSGIRDACVPLSWVGMHDQLDDARGKAGAILDRSKAICASMHSISGPSSEIFRNFVARFVSHSVSAETSCRNRYPGPRPPPP